VPSYVSTPLGPPPQLLQPGLPAYAFGSLPLGPTARFQINQVAITSNVATVRGNVIEGNIPSIGQLITIQGTSNNTPLFNVSNATITGVNISQPSGTGTITFALTHADVVAIADNGVALIPVAEVGELILTGTASRAFAIQDIAGWNENGKTVTWSVSYPTAPSSVTMALQGALVDQDSQYATLDSSTNIAGDGPRMSTLINIRFLRAKCIQASGTSPAAIVKISI
jgi:hypothetical protein